MLNPLRRIKNLNSTNLKRRKTKKSKEKASKNGILKVKNILKIETNNPANITKTEVTKRNIPIEIINSKGIEGILMTKGKTDLEGILMTKGKTDLKGILMININKEIGVINSKGETQMKTGASSKGGTEEGTEGGTEGETAGGTEGNSRNSKEKTDKNHTTKTNMRIKIEIRILKEKFQEKDNSIKMEISNKRNEYYKKVTNIKKKLTIKRVFSK